MADEVREKGKRSGGPLRKSSDRRHGTTSGYLYWQCRCDKCRAALKEYTEGLQERRLAELQPSDHGQTRAFRYAGCRCEACVEGYKEYVRAKGQRVRAKGYISPSKRGIPSVDLSELA